MSTKSYCNNFLCIALFLSIADFTVNVNAADVGGFHPEVLFIHKREHVCMVCVSSWKQGSVSGGRKHAKAADWFLVFVVMIYVL